MSYTTKTKWETRINYDNGIVLSRPSLKKLSVDIGLKIAGTTVCYGLGTVVGELMEQSSSIHNAVSQTVDYVSGIDVSNNLDGLVGLISGLYGAINSGTKTRKDNPNKLEKIELSPFKIT